jgi:TRAP-type C4-dicarboxylate transport system substrate-binding protein
MEHFAALVHRRSGGKIRIRVYYEGRLGTPEEVIAQIQFGGIAMARVNGLELSETVPRSRMYFVPTPTPAGPR